MEFWLFYSFLYRDPLNKIISAIDTIRTVIKNEKPKSVVCFNDGTLIGRVMPLLTGGIALKQAKIRRPIKGRLKEYIRPWGIKQFFRWHSSARRLIWKFERMRANYRLPPKKGKHILAVCAYHWKTVEHPVFQKPVLGDPYVTPVVEQLKGHTATYVDIAQREYVGFDAFKQKARSSQRHILFEQFLSWQVRRKAAKALSSIKSDISKITKMPSFRKSWEFEGIGIWPLIAPQFFCYFDNRLEGHLLDYYCAKEMIACEKPDAVIFPAEIGDLAYVFFKVCADSGIPCVGIQHGTFFYNPLTVHAPEEINAANPARLPMPAYLLLYGDYYRDFLVKNANFPAKNLAVIGNLRYDCYTRAKEITREFAKKKYHLDEKKPVVLYATTIMPYPEEGDEMTRAVFNAIKELGFTLIVKQHPGEPGDAIYHSLSRKLGIKPLITKQGSNLELLTASDVVIGVESTLDYEAMILDKPVIILNFGGRKNWLPFVDDGAALCARNPGEVAASLKNALFSQKTRKRLSENMKKLIAKHCYRIDGKSAERAADIVRGLIK